MTEIASKFCRPPFRIHPNAGGAYAVAQICATYGFPKLKPGAGAPPAVGILELGGGYSAADLSASCARYGYPAPAVQSLSVSGGGNSPGGAADGEVALDVQVAAQAYSYCTGLPARLVVAWCPNTTAAFAAGVDALVNAGAAVISISWGAPEDAFGDASAMHAALQRARAAGVPVLAASGDSGSGDGESGNHADYPASDPLAVGCGGTSLRSASPRDEVVWNDGRGGAAGGGASALFPVPAWQQGFAPPAARGRCVPDLSADADPATGYKVILDGREQAIGGTSAVAPLVAGLLAALKAGGADVSDLPDRLYQFEPAFWDVTAGNNGAFSATKGYDLASGLGSLNGAALYDALKGGAAGPPPPPPAGPTEADVLAAVQAGADAYAAHYQRPYARLIEGVVPWVKQKLDPLWQ